MTIDVIVGTLTTINSTFINPYTGEILDVNGDYYINDTSVSGGPGADDIALGVVFDQLWTLEDALGNLLIENIEVFLPAPGNDILLLASTTHVLGDLTIQTSDGDDIVWSNAGNDLLDGGFGNDWLDGGLGDDTIIGGVDDDTLAGGAGNDTYIYNTGHGNDTISETSGDDVISFGAGITIGDIEFSQSGDDLVLQMADTITIKDFYSGDSGKVVEQITFDDGSTFDLTTLLAMTPESAEAINTASTGFHSYHGSQDKDGTIELIDSATGVEINGNAWKQIALDYTITENTVISFEYKSTIEGELQGFGLETDNDYSTGAATYQLYGTDSAPNFSTNYSYNGSGDWEHFSINVGAYQTGDVDWLTFVNDHDGGAQDGNSFYRNIVLYERDPATANVAPQAVADEFEGTVNANIVGNLFADNFHGRDFDVDGDVLNAVAETINTAHGSVTISANGDFTYTPDAGFTGTDSFFYTLQDESGASDTVEATLYVGTTDADQTFATGAAFEHYNGGAGVDTVDYSTSATRVKLNLGAGIGWDGDANDDTYVHIENVIGTDIAGSRDFIYGSAGENHIWGLAGNDVLEGMGGADTIDGGSGADYASYSRSDAGVNVNLETGVNTGGHAEGDTLISIEKIIGSDHNDTLTGSDGDNTLSGGKGDDILSGKLGNDSLNGDYGNDTFIYSGGHDSITERGSGTDTVIFDDIWSPHDVVISGNTLTLQGSTVNYLSFNDINLIEVFQFDGYAPMDLATLKTFGSPVQVSGTSGDETFIATSAVENFDGNGGIDTVDYSNSDVRVKLNLGSGTGWEGDALGDRYTDIENVIGSDISGSRDFIYGSAGDNHIMGLAGNDQLEGMAGADILDGGAGGDFANYIQSDAGVNVNLETGINTGGHAEGDVLISIEKLIGSDFGDTLTGDALDNSLTGRAGNDVLRGGDGDDYINGNQGDDVIFGDAGNDTLYGEGGADTFMFEYLTTIGSVDTIHDFDVTEGDSIDISAVLDVFYDPITDAISDFVEVTQSGNEATISVDINGGADSFVDIISLQNVSDLADITTLITNGNLIV